MPAAGPLKKVLTLDPDLQFNVDPPRYTAADTPNKERRSASATIDTIVLHCTAGQSQDAAVQTLKDPDRAASAHIVIPDLTQLQDRGRQTVRLVPDEYVAWHCRQVLWQGAYGVNSRSLGVEIVNTAQAGDLYSPWQIAELVRWCGYWATQHPIRWIVTHAYLDPARRSDPCDTFPWDDFVKQLTALGTKPVQRDTPIKVIVNDQLIDADVELQDGTIRGEYRPLIEALGGKLKFDPATRKLYIYG